MYQINIYIYIFCVRARLVNRGWSIKYVHCSFALHIKQCCTSLSNIHGKRIMISTPAQNPCDFLSFFPPSFLFLLFLFYILGVFFFSVGAWRILLYKYIYGVSKIIYRREQNQYGSQMLGSNCQSSGLSKGMQTLS